MVTLNLGEIEFESKADVINTLEEIARAIEEGYHSGMTCGGVCWDIEGEEEPDDDEIEEEARYLEIGQRVYYNDPFYSNGSGYGIVKLIHFRSKDGDFFSDTIITLKMEDSGVEIETNGEYIYIIDEKKSAEIGETVCFEHLNNEYDYYMPSNDCNYMNGEL